MTLEPLRAKLMSVSMSPDTFKEIMALVMQLEAAAYVRGAKDAMVPDCRPDPKYMSPNPAWTIQHKETV